MSVKPTTADKPIYSVRLSTASIEKLKAAAKRDKIPQTLIIERAIELYESVMSFARHRLAFEAGETNTTSAPRKRVQLNVRINEEVQLELKKRANGNYGQFVEEALSEKMARDFK